MSIEQPVYPYKQATAADLKTLAEVNHCNRSPIHIAAQEAADGTILVPKDALSSDSYCHEQKAFVASLDDYEVELADIQFRWKVEAEKEGLL